MQGRTTGATLACALGSTLGNGRSIYACRWGIPAGTYSVFAVANGVPSAATNLTSLTISTTPSNAASPDCRDSRRGLQRRPVSGTTVNLSVLGADDGGESNLTYTWTLSASSNSTQLPSISDNGDNTAKNMTATFHQAGTYTFKATITDTGGLSTDEFHDHRDRRAAEYWASPSRPLWLAWEAV